MYSRLRGDKFSLTVLNVKIKFQNSEETEVLNFLFTFFRTFLVILFFFGVSCTILFGLIRT